MELREELCPSNIPIEELEEGDTFWVKESETAILAPEETRPFVKVEVVKDNNRTIRRNNAVNVRTTSETTNDTIYRVNRRWQRFVGGCGRCGRKLFWNSNEEEHFCYFCDDV